MLLQHLQVVSGGVAEVNAGRPDRTRWASGSARQVVDGTAAVMVLEIVRPYDASLDRSVAEIADEYRRRFHQEAVLRVTMPARMELR